MNGLLLYVLRHASFPDCTNRGVSARHDRLVITNVPGPFAPNALVAAARIVPGYACDPIIVPADGHDDGVGPPPMFGGNYASTSDSRLSEYLREHFPSWPTRAPIPIHDRFETWAEARLHWD